MLATARRPAGQNNIQEGGKMSYIEENLMGDEEVIHRAYLHRIIYAWPLLFALLILPGTSSDPNFSIYVMIIACFFIRAFIKRHYSEFAVTDKRVIHKTGWLHRKVSEV